MLDNDEIHGNCMLLEVGNAISNLREIISIVYLLIAKIVSLFVCV
jgi:hypothetical protein